MDLALLKNKPTPIAPALDPLERDVYLHYFGLSVPTSLSLARTCKYVCIKACKPRLLARGTRRGSRGIECNGGAWMMGCDFEQCQ